jgi:subtilisin family serine protease
MANPPGNRRESPNQPNPGDWHDAPDRRDAFHLAAGAPPTCSTVKVCQQKSEPRFDGLDLVAHGVFAQGQVGFFEARGALPRDQQAASNTNSGERATMGTSQREGRKALPPSFCVEWLESREMLDAGISTLTALHHAEPAEPSLQAVSLGPSPANQGTPVTAADLGTVRADHGLLTGKGYTVAVLDTGVDYRNPALGGGIGRGYKVVAGKNFVDTRDGNYVSNQPYPSNDPMDENGHGTHVAGIIAASKTTHGQYDGVAPEAQIAALRVLDKNGNGSWEWVEQALQWVLDNRLTYNITVVNMSLGAGNYTGGTDNFPEIQALLAKLHDVGVVCVSSAGNDYYANSSVPGLQFPSINPTVISVGAVWDTGPSTTRRMRTRSPVLANAVRIWTYSPPGP